MNEETQRAVVRHALESGRSDAVAPELRRLTALGPEASASLLDVMLDHTDDPRLYGLLARTPVEQASLARRLLERGEPGLAAESWRTLAASRPQARGARLGLAHSLKAAGRPDEALAALEGMSGARAGEIRAALQLEQGRPQEALEALEGFQQWAPAGSAVEGLAVRALIVLEQEPRLQGFLDQRLAEPGTRLPHVLGLVELLRQEGALGQAVRLAGRALDRWPEAPELRRVFSDLLVAMGRELDALQSWRELATLRPDLPEAERQQAAILRSLGLEDDAAFHSRRAAALAEGRRSQE
jgi:tetratricopeptide (TPR) repeat protein